MKLKLNITAAIFIIIFAALLSRVAYFKICYGNEYETRSKLQSLGGFDKTIPARRGEILDRNSVKLAVSVPVYNVILEPVTISQLNDKEQIKIFNLLEKTLPLENGSLENILSKDSEGNLINNTYYYPVAKNVSYDKAMEIENQNLTGVWLEEKQKRKYPFGSLAAHVIGFVKGENISGLEKIYNSALEGYDGRQFRIIEGSKTIPQNYSPKNGFSIVTTIDQNIQKIAENGVRNAMEEFPCETASVIIMNPNTGEILAMADSNQFDLNNPSKPNNVSKENFYNMPYEKQSEYLNNMWKNFNVTNTFEPGSIFKPMVIAAALDEGIITPESTFYCNGYKQVEDRKIHCIRRSGHGSETLEEVISNSCNSAMMDIVEIMGNSIFYKYQTDFGFGEKTGIDLPHEESCINLLYKCEELGPVELATSSFGQSFNCTPIQAITAFSVLASGGSLMKPYVVSKVVDEYGNAVLENKPQTVRKVVSKESCAIVNKYLQSVIDSGTGKKAKIDGYYIAGKSGTSEQGKRGDDLYTITFAGFLPAENPKVAALVVIDKPFEYSDGVTTAAPAFREVMLGLIDYMEIPPSVKMPESENSAGISLKDFTGLPLDEALEYINKNGLKHKIVGNGNTVANQFPKEGTLVNNNTEILIYVS